MLVRSYSVTVDSGPNRSIADGNTHHPMASWYSCDRPIRPKSTSGGSVVRWPAVRLPLGHRPRHPGRGGPSHSSANSAVYPTTPLQGKDSSSRLTSKLWTSGSLHHSEPALDGQVFGDSPGFPFDSGIRPIQKRLLPFEDLPDRLPQPRPVLLSTAKCLPRGSAAFTAAPFQRRVRSAKAGTCDERCRRSCGSPSFV